HVDAIRVIAFSCKILLRRFLITSRSRSRSWACGRLGNDLCCLRSRERIGLCSLEMILQICGLSSQQVASINVLLNLDSARAISNLKKDAQISYSELLQS